MPRVSVITPAYNAGPSSARRSRLCGCRTSATGRSCAPTRLDRQQVEIARGFGDRVTVVKTPGRFGPAGARNMAVARRAGAPRVLDADDLWHRSSSRSRSRSTTESRPSEATLASSRAMHKLFPEGLAEWTYLERFGADGKDELTTLLETNPITRGVVPKAVVEEAGGFSPETWGTEDHDLWIRIVDAATASVVNPRPLAGYPVGTKASVASNLADGAANQVTFRLALERGNLDPKQARVARRQVRFYEALRSLRLSGKENRSLRPAPSGRPPLRLSVAAAAQAVAALICALATGKVAQWCAFGPPSRPTRPACWVANEPATRAASLSPARSRRRIIALVGTQAGGLRDRAIDRRGRSQAVGQIRLDRVAEDIAEISIVSTGKPRSGCGRAALDLRCRGRRRLGESLSPALIKPDNVGIAPRVRGGRVRRVQARTTGSSSYAAGRPAGDRLGPRSGVAPRSIVEAPAEEARTQRWKAQDASSGPSELEGLRVIKIGAGRATNAVHYAQRGATTVLDISPLGLEQATEVCGAHGLEAGDGRGGHLRPAEGVGGQLRRRDVVRALRALPRRAPEAARSRYTSSS